MHSVRLFVGLTALLGILPLQSVSALSPSIERVQYHPVGRVTLQGKGFGLPCQVCEVWVRYSQTLLYAVPIDSWQPSRIEVELPDLNQDNTQIQIQVKRDQTSSVWKPFKLRRHTALRLHQQRAHSLNIGEKGKDSFAINDIHAQCGKTVQAYDHTELVIQKKRFATAQIAASPRPGCEHCTPVVVRWYNEPTGHLSYEIKVFGRLVQGICKDRLRTAPP